MELRLLGRVGLHNAGQELPAGHPRRRCVLAVLAMTPRQPVLTGALIDQVWGDHVPADVRNVLYSYVSRLRAVLASADPVHGRSMLRRVSGGYLLDIDPDLVDLHRSRSLVTQARRQARAGELAMAAARYEEACELWRAPPLADLDGEWVQRVRASLDQERLAMLVESYELELRLGRQATAVGPLANLLAAHPLNEAVAGLLMTGLYAAGQQADALAVFAKLRRRMVEELGDQPGEQLQELHQRILRRDVPALPGPVAAEPSPATDPPARTDSPQPSSRPAPAELPADTAGFVGREPLLWQLDVLVPESGEPVSPPALAAVVGPAGVGKTALVVHWANQVAGQFSDGQIYLDLRGSSLMEPAPDRPAGALPADLGGAARTDPG